MNFYFLHKLPADKVNREDKLFDCVQIQIYFQKQKQCLNLDSLDTRVIIAFVHKR